MRIRSIKYKVSITIILLLTISIGVILLMTLFLGELNQGYIVLSSKSVKTVNNEDIDVLYQAIQEGQSDLPISYSTSEGNRIGVIQKSELFDCKIFNISVPGENPYIYNNKVSKYIIFLLSWIIAIFAISILISQRITKPTIALLDGIKAIEKGNMEHCIKFGSSDEIGQLAEGINLMSQSLKNSFNELEKQKDELFDKNCALQEINMELEASYEQLTATIEQLEETENKYYTLVHNMPEIVCVIRDSGEIVFVNRKVKNILGYDKDELIGRSVLQGIDAENPAALLNQIINELKHKHSMTSELNLIKKNGSNVLVEATVTRYILKGHMSGIQVIARDIMMRKEMERQILRRNKELGVLNYLSKSLNSTINLNKVLNLVAQEVSTILDAPMCVVRLLDNSAVFLKARAFAGTFFKNEFTLELFPVINIYDDVMGKVILDSEMHSTDIIEEEWLVYELNQLKEEHERITNIVLIPLINKTKKLGLIAVGAHRKMAESDVSLLWSIANNASVAIDNAILYDNSKKYFIKTIDALIATVEAKDKYTEGHSQRVARYAVEIAKSLKFDKERIEDLKIAGILHDIGKIGISDSILLKSGALTDFEFEQIKQHPIISKKILYPVGLSDRIIDTITYHHERYDGKGYPLGLSGHELQIEAQIIAVADTFDAITSNRSYRKAKSPDFAISELLRNRGTQFAPDVVDTMVELYTKRKDLIRQIMYDDEKATG